MGCPESIRDKVFDGRDNVLRYVLYADGDALADLSGVTRVTIDPGGAASLIDSAVVGSGVIWWTDQAQHRGETVDVLSLKLGGQGVALGTYENVEIVVYDAVYTNGLEVETDIELTFQ